jgi:hypothetical protein
MEKVVPFREHGIVTIHTPKGEVLVWIPHCQKKGPHTLFVWLTVALTNKRVDSVDTEEKDWPLFVRELHRLGHFERITVDRGVATQCEITLKKFRTANFDRDLIEKILRQAVEMLDVPEEQHYDFA